MIARQVGDLDLDVIDRLLHRLDMDRRIVTPQSARNADAQSGERLERLVVKLARPAGALGVGGGDRASQPVGLDAAADRDGIRAEAAKVRSSCSSVAVKGSASGPRSNAPSTPRPAPW